MSLIFKATNPGATQAIWPQAISWRLDRYFDKPGQLRLEIDGSHGVADRAIVEAYYESEDGSDSFSDIPFRGYLMPPDDSGDETAKLTIYEIQKILDHRYTQPARYAAGTTLTQILTDGWPAASTPPGLLCMANNLVQPGSFVSHSGNIWKLLQGGTNYLGSLHTLGDHVYIDSVQQTWGTSSAVTTGKYYQDDTYLYIYSAKNPYYSLVLVEGIYETNLRLGTLSAPSATFSRSWRVGNSQISNEIKRLIQAAGLEWQYSHNADGYTYLNATAAVGRGAAATYKPTYRYDQCSIKKVRKNTTGGSVPLHALRGMGIGSGASRQYYTEASFPQGLRFIDMAEYSSQFYDQLQGTIGKLYDDRQDTTAWEIEAEDDPAAMPGDYVKIVPEFEAPTIERIKQISEGSDVMMKIYLGQRPKDVEDILRAKYDIRDTLQSDLDVQYSEISLSGQENVDSYTPCKITLKVETDDWDTELDSKFLLSVSMEKFEQDSSVTSVPATNHGSSGSETSTGYGGEHSDHDLNAAGAIDVEYTAGISIYWAGATEYEDGDGSHYHDISEDLFGVASTWTHQHEYSSGTTPGYADAHDDHSLGVNPETDVDSSAGVNKSDAAGGTSSWVAYMTVVIKVINSAYPSGQSVSGSPFYDIALTESMDDIDVTDLIQPGENTIQVSISRYDAVLPGQTAFVKARASVSLTGKLIVDTYYS